MKLFILMIFILFAFQGCLTKEKQVTITQKAPVATKAPIMIEETEALVGEELVFKTLRHERIKIIHDRGILRFLTAAYREKNVLLFLFGKNCPHCRNEIPSILQLSKNPNIKIIGIHAQADIGDQALKRYIKKIGFTFDILSFSDDIKLIRLLQKRGLWEGEVPSHIFVDSIGNMQVLSLPEIEGRI